MAEAFIQVVLDNLSSLIKEEIGLMMGVDDEMDKLSSTLTTIQAVLEDAEEKQIKSKPIRDWLRKLNALVYEIDDFLDECATHVSKLNRADSKLTRYNPKKLLYRHKIARRMKQVKEKLDAVAAERAQFHLREMPLDRPREVAAASRETGSLLNDSDKIFGRDEDVEQIVKMLVNDVSEKRETSVLPIIGVGGLGKTTLAQLVFKDPRVVEHFEKRIWVCVSDNFEIKTLVNAMIESGTGSGKASDLRFLDSLEQRLGELLSQKRYLIVLDDVWNEQQEKWFDLRDMLSCGSTGASIIVTTRLKKVADIMGTLPAHSLKGLSDEHCWMLLRQRAFGHEEEVSPDLQRIGMQIVKKCAGVPMAAKALGGILRFKRSEKDWIYVKDSDIWKLSSEDTLILPALRLSYHHLPLELRQCFAYFAAFDKDERIRKEELIRLWMAHGYISDEDVGYERCNELMLRSLVEPVKSFDQYDCVIMHDLAQSIMENKVPGIQIERNVTAASTIRQVDLLERRVCFPKRFQQDMDISSIMELTSLRVLNAAGTRIVDLPQSIGNLKHLRYLNFSFSAIRTLPNSLCGLWNLQTLNLDHCSRLVALPKNMRYMHNLRHLCLEKCDSLTEMPSKIRELSRLETLSIFVVGLNKGNQLEELQCLKLSGKLEIRHLERVKDHVDAKKANIVEKENLRKLTLSWERNSLSKFGEDVDEKVLEALQPHPNLASLSIIGFRGRCFPLWRTNTVLGNISEIDIKNCTNCTRLSKLGELPHLKRLVLEKMAVEYIIEDEVERQFLALEYLDLNDLPNLKGFFKEQESKESFPNLNRLFIKGCSSLKLPRHSSVRNLYRLECSSSNLALFSEQQNTLTDLKVIIEENMTCFPIEMLVKFSNLLSLEIHHAKEISVTGEGLQLNLRTLRIENCETLTCLPEGLLRHLTALVRLNISECPELLELPEEIKHLQNLEYIDLSGLAKMACLPEALQHLASLRTLRLTKLPQLDSLPDLPDLTYLQVIECPELEMPDKLPSLHTLFLRDCPKVASLPDLPDLTDLKVIECPELEMPDKLPSLHTLHLIDCPKVASLPDLPDLTDLRVEGCPELERRCQRRVGEDWHRIAHIPRLQIGNDYQCL